MKLLERELELAAGLAWAGATWIAGHYTAILSGAIGTVALAVWLLKLRREWLHRDDPPEDES
jgi:hypothetical protein